MNEEIRKQSSEENAKSKLKKELSLYTKKWKDDSYESYMDRKKRIEEIISTQEDREFFCHYLSTQHKNSRFWFESMTSMAIPIEIAIFSSMPGVFKDNSYWAIIISAIVVAIFIFGELSKIDRETCFYEECIEIAKEKTADDYDQT